MKTQQALDKFYQSLVISDYSKQTINSYMSALKLFFEYISINKLTQVSNDHIQNYLQFCREEKKYSTSALRQSIAAIKYFYIHILKENVPDALNVKIRKSNKLPLVLSKEEVIRLLKVTTNIKHKSLLMMIYSAGLRLGELLNLQIPDIDSNRMKIHIRQAKGKKDRYVFLSEKLLDLLKTYFKEYKPNEYLFEGQKGNQYSAKSVQSVMNQALKKAGIRKPATVHTLRHSFATHLLEDGTDIRYIQQLLGHKKLETTQIYTHITGSAMDKIKSPLDSLDI
jgi:integrase/recombinase XerD